MTERGFHWPWLGSWLFYVNFFLVQWFFVRLTRVGVIVAGNFVHSRWTVTRWVVPLTGWWSDYKFWPHRKGKK